MKYIIDVICAWCKKKIGEKESQTPGDTHTVCPECEEKQNKLLAILIAETEASDTIPFMGEPMPNREVSMRDYYGV